MRRLQLLVLLIFISLNTACSSIVSLMTGSVAEDLSMTILNSDDPETVAEAIPTYLLMVDSFLRSNPDDEELLLTASRLNSAYANFVEPDRAQKLANKSRNLALRAACSYREDWCNLAAIDFAGFSAAITDSDEDDIPVLYALGTTWASWVQQNSEDWNAVAQLSRVKLLMQRIIDLNEAYEYGTPHLYMGVLESFLPAALGGRPEIGRKHFERAIELADGKYLMSKVVFAEKYAKLMFDQELHDGLLKEVLSTDPVVENMTLINTLAKQRAQSLLDESNEYF